MKPNIRPLAGLASLLACMCLAPPRAAQFVNGDFETGDLTGWTVEYGEFHCGAATDWTTVQPAGHPGAAIHTASSPLQSGQTLDVDPYGGDAMVRINDIGGGYHATRITQTASLPAIGGSPHLRILWGAMLVDPGHPASCQPWFSIDVFVNGSSIEHEEANASTASAPGSGWTSAGAALWYKPGEFCTDLSAYGVGAQIEVRLTAVDCGYGGHGGFAFLDDVRILNWCHCPPAPQGLTGWWPLDEPAGNGQPAADLARGNAGLRLGSLSDSLELVDGSLVFGPGTRVVVADPPDGALDVGDVLPPILPDDGAFSVDAWIRTTASTPRQTIVHKVDCTALPGSGGEICWPRGYAFYVSGDRLGLDLHEGPGPGGSFLSDPLPELLDGGWHLVAATVDRLVPNGVRLWMDGVAVPPFVHDATAITGSLENPSPFLIGDDFGGGHFLGGIDEVEFFRRALTATEIGDVFAAGSNGKCKAAVSAPPVWNFCYGKTSTMLPVKIHNGTAEARDFFCDIGPLPVGGDCTVAGPAGLSYLPTTLGPDETKTVHLAVDRPAGLTVPGQIACYRLRVFTFDGLEFERTGKLGLLPPAPCFEAIYADAALAVGAATPIQFQIAGGGPIGAVPYTITAVSVSGTTSSAPAVSLDGAPLGASITGITDPSATSIQVVVQAETHHPLAVQEIRLTSDLDLDGAPDIWAVAEITTAPSPASGVPALELVRAGEPPNPVALLPGVTSGPVLGATWDPIVDHLAGGGFAPTGIFDVLVVTSGPSNPPTGIPLGVGGMLLCDLGNVLGMIVVSPGSPFQVPIPGTNPALAGFGVCAQAASASASGAIELTNALDVTLGDF